MRHIDSGGCPANNDLHDKLLINSKLCKKKATAPEIVALPRSSLLNRVQDFLPQMAQANEKLKTEMATAPMNHFDIENIDDAPADIIEMNVALVELSDSDASDVESSSDDVESQSDDDLVAGEVTLDNIRLPKPNVKRGKIEVLESKNEEL
ncbi:NOP protein chaperone 1 isoform X2 [Ambystoma mexicanum]|uniref:NOP protein chaperone 1 isoform X2 n=1 Tax=Ambystoma mexicanum TaxID=8296 RepID=UPI0037E80C52